MFELCILSMNTSKFNVRITRYMIFWVSAMENRRKINVKVLDKINPGSTLLGTKCHSLLVENYWRLRSRHINMAGCTITVWSHYLVTESRSGKYVLGANGSVVLVDVF